MTLQLVYDEYCRMNAGQKTCSYSSFCRRYADKKPNWEPQDLFTNLHYVTGDVMEIDFAGDCQANDKLTYLNERQIDLPVDVRFFGSQRGVQRADGRELSWLCPLSYFFVVTAPSFGCCSAHSIGVSCKTDSFYACSMR